MDTFTLAHAKEHLEDLIERARRGEDVRIEDERGAVTLIARRRVDLSAPRVTDAIEPLPVLEKPRVPGRLAGKLPTPPDGFFDPLTADELKDWYGEGD